MFFAKSLVVVAALAAQVLCHSVVQPVMGINGKAVRSDTQRPSNAKPCGNTALSKIDSSQVVTMTGTSFTATSINFNAKQDGSMQFTASVDATGTGKSFKAATITKNGPNAPPKVGQTAEIDVSLPEGTTCNGGASKDLCLVSFKSSSGFGNCVVVKQAGAGGAAKGAKANPKTKATRSRHPRNFAAPANAKRAISWVWAPEFN
ncbi:unnamed protein product [Rhizoctonia solani]|uniref:Uncharacterized protein n=1 Tax=Rhizoctonia solani TaxID=456999 RepID=A0A8H7GZP2_9AGAM|nr:uncharacterized protein RhiXN_08686 [Rhizoctonia solani]KAF8670699.1 hypothetical protein RHS04_08567 [Rhizoctonia solani]KAF8676537.1 hypothetical protein RHS04_06475 [Rhizoctonia solani]QRW23650.1 hypothetical protein RhiXN_08686 [Rhizoctonia solani]CAE6366564.1 unnamed protein product [Rhizoctonia solani]